MNAPSLAYWTRRSPYFEATRRHGCRSYSVSNHMYQPAGYDDPVAEYWNLVNGAVLWDVACERQVEIAGPDALAFANMLTPRDVTRCPVGRGRYTVITSGEGGIVNDPVMLRLAEDRFWFSTSDSDLLLWTKGIATFAGMDVRIAEPDVSPIQIQGPRSGAILQGLAGDAAAALRFYELMETDLDGIPVVVTRTGWSGELGYEIFLRDGARGLELWQRVLDAGAPHGLVVAAASDIRRVEAGILGYGADIGLDTNPFEAGLGWMVDPAKPADYIGRAALEDIRAAGPARRLVGIVMSGAPWREPFEATWPVTGGGGEIGRVTVMLHSPGLARNIGYAMLQTPWTAAGTPLELQTPAGRRRAVVSPLPFVAPKSKTTSLAAT